MVRKPKRAQAFDTQRAKVRVIRHKGKPHIIRLTPSEIEAREDYIRHSLHKLLYPEHPLTPVDIKEEQINGQPHWGMVSEIVKPRHPDYLEYQKMYYDPKRGNMRLDTDRPIPADLSPADQALAGRHHKFVREDAEPKVGKMFRDCGINPDVHPVNIGRSNGEPVFFEQHDPYPPHLWFAIENLPNGKKKIDAKRLMDEWMELRPDQKRILYSMIG